MKDSTARSNETLRADRRIDRLLSVAAVLLAVYFLITCKAKLDFVSDDIRDYFLPWLGHILHFGRWASLEGSYATYTPPYLYVLSTFSFLSPLVGPVTIIKLSSTPFLLASGWLSFSLCKVLGCSVRRCWLASGIVLLAPEIVQNVFKWGQCDIQYTCFLLVFLRLILANRPVAAMVAFAVAISLKLQAIFAGPLILALMLCGQIPWWTVLIVPTTYLVVMIPAALAGRPWLDLCMIYRMQAGIFTAPAWGAPNPYVLTLHWTQHRTSGLLYNLVMRGGLILGLLCIAALVVFLLRSHRVATPRGIVAGLCLSLLVAPFVLPKMHERYMFPGNTLVLILAMAVPRLFVPACLLQIAALIVYQPYLTAHMRNAFYYITPVLLVAGSIWYLLREVKRNNMADQVLPPVPSFSE